MGRQELVMGHGRPMDFGFSITYPLPFLPRIGYGSVTLASFFLGLHKIPVSSRFHVSLSTFAHVSI